jgi:hypothetical protein
MNFHHNHTEVSIPSDFHHFCFFESWCPYVESVIPFQFKSSPPHHPLKINFLITNVVTKLLQNFFQGHCPPLRSQLSLPFLMPRRNLCDRGFQGSDNDDDDLGLGTMWTGWWKPTFRRSVPSPTLGPKWWRGGPKGIIEGHRMGKSQGKKPVRANHSITTYRGSYFGGILTLRWY